MKRLLVILLFAAAPAFGAEYEAGIRHVVVSSTGESGDLDLPLSRGFGATFDVFFTERLSAQFAASFANPEAILRPANAEPVDLGTLGLYIYSATARYHLAPASRLSAYAGAGPAFVVLGNLDDQFGDDIYVEYDSQTTFVAEAGVRFRLHPRLFVDIGAAYMPLGGKGEIELNVDPLIVSGGLAWRF